MKISGKRILLVDVKKSDEATYLDNKDFYVRTNPATDKLEGKEMVDYCSKRFTKPN